MSRLQIHLVFFICNVIVKTKLAIFEFLPAATKLGQGNVFTGICDSVNRGVCLSACWDTPQDQAPQSRHPPEQTPPRADPPRADCPGTRPSRADTPPRSRHPPRSRPPWKQTPVYGQ